MLVLRVFIFTNVLELAEDFWSFEVIDAFC